MPIWQRFEWVSIAPKNSVMCKEPPSPQHMGLLELLLDILRGSGWKICLQMMGDRLVTCRIFISRSKVMAATKQVKRGEMHSGNTLKVSLNSSKVRLKGNTHAQQSKGTAYQEVGTACGAHQQKIWEIQGHSVQGWCELQSHLRWGES